MSQLSKLLINHKVIKNDETVPEIFGKIIWIVFGIIVAIIIIVIILVIMFVKRRNK